VAAIIETGMPRGVALPRLREVRLRKLLTQEELAARSGVSSATISLLELGNRTAAVSTARKLATALGIDAAELMTPSISS
jgi:transcriptional regulator with XRE-family HTH domain